MVAFLIAALIFGVTVVFVIPFVQGQINRFPGFAKITGNRFVQLLVVGAIGLIVLAIFGRLAKGVRMKV